MKAMLGASGLPDQDGDEPLPDCPGSADEYRTAFAGDSGELRLTKQEQQRGVWRFATMARGLIWRKRRKQPGLGTGWDGNAGKRVAAAQ